MTSGRGGLLLGGAFVTFAVSAALMHSYAVFLVAFLEEFRWSRAETSLAYSVSAFVSGASAPFVGALVDRLGPRRLVLLGGSMLAIGLVGSAYVARALADDRALRRPHDRGSQLPRARGVRADPLAPLRAQSWHGDLDRAVGQRVRDERSRRRSRRS